MKTDLRIRLSGIYTYEEIGEMLGISKASVYRKMNGINEFTKSEVFLLESKLKERKENNE